MKVPVHDPGNQSLCNPGHFPRTPHELAAPVPSRTFAVHFELKILAIANLAPTDALARTCNATTHRQGHSDIAARGVVENEHCARPRGLRVPHLLRKEAGPTLHHHHGTCPSRTLPKLNRHNSKDVPCPSMAADSKQQPTLSRRVLDPKLWCDHLFQSRN